MLTNVVFFGSGESCVITQKRIWIDHYLRETIRLVRPLRPANRSPVEDVSFSDHAHHETAVEHSIKVYTQARQKIRSDRFLTVVATRCWATPY